MFGFRVLAIVLALICLGGAAMMVFPERQPAITINGFFLNPVLSEFLQSQEPRDIVVRNHMKYLLFMGAVGAFGLAILFFISVFNPLLMRPFLVVAIISLILGVALALRSGIQETVSWRWWVVDAVGGMILVVLLVNLFPRKKPV